MRTKLLVAPALLFAALAPAACGDNGATPRTPAPTVSGAGTRAPTSVPGATTTPAPPPTPAGPPQPACSPPYPTAEPRAFCADPGRYERATLADVIDGDTIDVLAGGAPERVRLFGIDAPERGDACAREATERVAELAAAGVHLRADDRNRDSYGRLLRYVYTPAGLSIDAVLIAEGLALAWTRDGALRDEFVAIEAETRAAGRGCLW